MAAIKSFLVYHGEKVGLILVALVALWSITGNLLSSKNVLTTPEGEFVIDQSEVDRNLSNIKRHLSSKSKTVGDLPEVKLFASKLQSMSGAWKRPLPPASMEWVAYVQPPKPKEIRKDKIVAPESEEPPINYVTAIGAPVEWEIEVGGKQIAVIAQDSPAIRWPKQGSVRVELYRMAVGEGKEKLSKAARDVYKRRRPGVEVDVPDDLMVETVRKRRVRRYKSTKQKTVKKKSVMEGPEGFIPPEAMDPGMGVHNKPVTKKQPKPVKKPDPVVPGGFGGGWGAEMGQMGMENPAERSVPGFAGKEVLPSSYQEYVENLQLQAETLSDDLSMLVEPASIRKPKWVLVTDDMSSYVERPDVKEILEKGLPKADPRDEEEIDDSPVTTKGAAAPNALTGLLGAGAPAVGVGGGGEGLNVGGILATKYGTYAPRFYAYLDKNVEENMIYRYRLVAKARVRDIPKELRQDLRYRFYDLRAEIGDMGASFFYALPKSDIEKYMKEEKLGLAAMGQPTPELMKDPSTGVRKSLRTEGGDLTPIGRAFRSQQCYSTFAYTAAVLTPIRLRVELNGVSVSPEGVAQASIRVIAVADDGTSKSDSYFISAKSAPKIGLRELVKLDENGKAIRKANGFPEEKSLADIYESIDSLDFVPIGEEKEIGKKKWDFRTGWGLVDIRKCTVVKKLLKREDDDAKWELLGQPLSMEIDYIVLKELNPAKGLKPRYKRIARKVNVRAPSETRKEEVEYDWWPELHNKIREKVEAEKKKATDKE